MIVLKINYCHIFNIFEEDRTALIKVALLGAIYGYLQQCRRIIAVINTSKKKLVCLALV